MVDRVILKHVVVAVTRGYPRTLNRCLSLRRISMPLDLYYFRGWEMLHVVQHDKTFRFSDSLI